MNARPLDVSKTAPSARMSENMFKGEFTDDVDVDTPAYIKQLSHTPMTLPSSIMQIAEVTPDTLYDVEFTFHSARNVPVADLPVGVLTARDFHDWFSCGLDAYLVVFT